MVSDMATSPQSEAELNRLFALLRTYERRGRFQDLPTARLAQALVPFVDPFVFLRTPALLSTRDRVPIDDALDALVLQPPVLEEQLAELLAADLSPSVRLIAGALWTFSRKWDVTVSVDHVVATARDDEIGVHGADKRPWVLNGRSSLAFEAPFRLIAFPGASNQRWLTRMSGGLIPFVDATLEYFPGSMWTERLQWEPESRDPLTWKREGRRAAWFERRRGPIRQLYRSDLLYRQPTVARWVCTVEEWTRIEALVGRPRRQVQSAFAPPNDR
jgi:hypothetical protein